MIILNIIVSVSSNVSNVALSYNVEVFIYFQLEKPIDCQVCFQVTCSWCMTTSERVYSNRPNCSHCLLPFYEIETYTAHRRLQRKVNQSNDEEATSSMCYNRGFPCATQQIAQKLLMRYFEFCVKVSPGSNGNWFDEMKLSTRKQQQPDKKTQLASIYTWGPSGYKQQTLLSV